MIELETQVNIGGQDEKRITAWSVSERIGTLGKRFSITLNGNLGEDSLGALVDILAGYKGNANVLIKEGSIREHNYGVRRGTFQTMISGHDKAEELINLAPEKKHIILNDYNLRKKVGGLHYYIGDDQRIKVKLNNQIVTVPFREIPTDPDLEGTWETHIFNTYNEVIEWVCSQLDISLINNTPDLPLRHIITIEPTSSYFNVIKNLVSVWNPAITIDYQYGKWNLSILDVEGWIADESADEYLAEIDPQKMEILEYRQTRNKIINHAKITGGQKEGISIEFTEKKIEQEKGDFLNLDPDEVLVRFISQDNLLYGPDKILEDCPTWVFNGGILKKKYFKIDPDNYSNRVLLKEEYVVYGDDNRIYAKDITEYFYRDLTAAKAQKRTEYRLVRRPHDNQKNLVKVREIRTEFGDYIEEAGENEKIDIESGLVVYDWVGDPPSRVNPQPLTMADENGLIDYSAHTNQSFSWAEIKRTFTTYDVQNEYWILRNKIVWDNLKGKITDFENEYIPINYDKKNIDINPDPTIWEYKDTTSINEHGHRPMINIQLPDLLESDGGIAGDLWERIKRKSGSMVKTIKIKLAGMFNIPIGAVIKMKDLEYKENTGNGYILNQVAGGYFFVVGYIHEYQKSDLERLTTTLELREAI